MNPTMQCSQPSRSSPNTSRPCLKQAPLLAAGRPRTTPFTAHRQPIFRCPSSPRQSRQHMSASASSAVPAAQRRSPVATAALAAEDVPPPPEVAAPQLPFRIGHGFDLHRLEEGYPLIIGGIDIPHTRGCVAHSDGDVLLHCITDAVLGALSLPDIGQLFPDNDPKWKGANSDVFIKEALRLMREKGYSLGNLDATIIAERPKLSPVKNAIRDNLCALMNAHPSVINIKAKTHEKVDSLGENRSIGCHAVVLLLRDS